VTSADVVALDSRASERRLREIAEELEQTGWSFEVLDASWRLFHVSSELRSLLYERDAEQIGYGRHMLETRYAPAYGMVTSESRKHWLEVNAPYMLHDDPGIVDRFADVLPPDHLAVLRSLEPRPAPPRWVSQISFDGNEFTGKLHYVGERLTDERGAIFGYIVLYGPSLPASVLGLLTRGDAATFARMAELTEPGRRQAAVLFAALEDSGALSRRLPSAVYFELIRELVTAIDAAVVARLGLIGKHTGDGVTAFFLADDHDSRSGAARAALEVAGEIAAIAERTVADGRAGRLLEAGGWRFNTGVHWGSTLYIGQVATGGRLEVQALGDEFNEALRIQQTARGGGTLASKALLERLDADDAAALGIDPGRMTYTTVGELPHASDKAIRDAGTIAVTQLQQPLS
jgi:class 3 adenylate cyclase